MRIAAIGSVAARERVYRVTIKPVVGKLTGTESGLKVLVGYDLLVLVRPAAAKDNLKIERLGNAVVVTNLGAASVELAEGRQCEILGRQALPASARQAPLRRCFLAATPSVGRYGRIPGSLYQWLVED